ncbi:MAG: hypothetical protein V1874_12135 [Spirochaetota bacterium]
MKNIIKSLIIMLITALVVTACGGSDSSDSGSAPQLDSALFARWEGITEHSGHDCPTFMRFYNDGRFENYWLDPATDEINGGMAGTYSTSGVSITANITDGWNPEGLMNWDDFPDEVNTGTYSVSGNVFTLTTEHAVMTLYKSIDPALRSDLEGPWIHTDGTKIITLTFGYTSAAFTMRETNGAVTTGLEQGKWDIYMSVETGGPSGEYIEFITDKFLDVDDADEDGNTSEMLNSFIYRRFTYTLNTGVVPNTLTLDNPDSDPILFIKE